MHDDFESAAWADNHARLSTQIHKLIASIGLVFDRLHAYQFDAPWRTSRSTDTARKC